MNTYFTLNTLNSSQTSFALLSIDDSYLILKITTGRLKKEKKIISLKDAQHIGMDSYHTSKRLFIVIGNETYFFYENGAGVIHYLYKHLSQITEVKKYA
ncbi:hypothetical protein [Vagococcus silagei]|uniref:GRAM domain-containing protein n=2 Tax=Vagococcus silagei TaxID=2508885 RepID=A0A4S3B417_9ENTE|nr:hypothetical protein ESZ54_08500 [Vagococcus silagei]